MPNLFGEKGNKISKDKDEEPKKEGTEMTTYSSNAVHDPKGGRRSTRRRRTKKSKKYRKSRKHRK